MKPIPILLIMILAVAPVFSQESILKKHQNTEPAPAAAFKQKEFNVSGKVLVINPYCSGVAPSKEMMDEISIPRVFANQKLYVRADTFNNDAKPIVVEFQSDKEGNFSFQLLPGKYCIIQEEQTKPLKSSDMIKDPLTKVISEKCIQKWWSEGYLVFEVVDKDIEKLDITFYPRCFVQGFCPCIEYDGPIPQ